MKNKLSIKRIGNSVLPNNSSSSLCLTTYSSSSYYCTIDKDREKDREREITSKSQAMLCMDQEIHNQIAWSIHIIMHDIAIMRTAGPDPKTLLEWPLLRKAKDKAFNPIY